jgi:signal recognition particle receptor subunit beta
MNVETVKHGSVVLHMWDVGGQEQLRRHWSHHLAGTQGLVFLVDSADSGRFGSAAAELASVLEAPELNGVPVLVVGNKADQPLAQSAEALTAAMALVDMMKERTWKLLCTSASKGDGLDTALAWLAEHSIDLA